MASGMLISCKLRCCLPPVLPTPLADLRLTAGGADAPGNLDVNPSLARPVLPRLLGIARPDISTPQMETDQCEVPTSEHSTRSFEMSGEYSDEYCEVTLVLPNIFIAIIYNLEASLGGQTYGISSHCVQDSELPTGSVGTGDT